uniref:Protein kinase domain-containing protein n=1 Tax=uncultured bacterium A1Q1_fos_2140 TaxID=1256565 RepID=L7VWX7_9BACT|nr:hypothetical protein [uncultured bacterium A1Q1_fos_2140]
MHSKNNADQELTAHLNVSPARMQMEYIQHLVRQGASLKDCRNRNNDTALHQLVRHYRSVVLDSGLSESVAAQFGKAIQYLQEQGVDVHAKNSFQYSALQILLNTAVNGISAVIIELTLIFIKNASVNLAETNDQGLNLFEIITSHAGSPTWLIEKLQQLPSAYRLEETAKIGRSYAIEADDCLDLEAFMQAAEYDKQRLLGKGRGGTVYYTRLHGQDVALKTTSLVNNNSSFTKSIQRSCKEIAFLQALTKAQVPNIIGFKGYCIHHWHIHLFMEYAEFGSLKAYYEKYPRPDWGRFSDRSLPFQLAQDILTGVYWVHKFNIILCDLKPENIVLTRDPASPNEICAKLIDFELSQKTGLSLNCWAGTYWFIAPDALCDGNSKKSDIYSYGRVLLSIAQWKPHPDFVGKSLADYKKNGKLQWERFGEDLVNGRLQPDIPLDTPPEIAMIIRETSASNPKDRPSAPALKSRLNAFFWQSKEKKEAEDADLLSWCSLQ